jgi:ankyrin repeat protein
MQPTYTVRAFLVNAAAAANLLIAAAFLSFGVWILAAGADAINTVFQARGELAKVAPAGDKDLTNALDIGSKGIAGVFLALATAAAIIALVNGLPHLLIGQGLLARHRWARILGIVFGVFALLEGIGLLVSPGSATYPLLAGGVLVFYGLLSLVALIGAGAKAQFAPAADHEAEVGPAVQPALGLGGLLTVLFALSTLAFAVLYFASPRSTQAKLGDAKKEGPTQVAAGLLGTWSCPDPTDRHTLSFQPEGKLVWTSADGHSIGKYSGAGADQVLIEYELPESVYLAQKAVFDAAKKQFDDGLKDLAKDNPLGLVPVFNLVEPVRSVQGTVKYHIADGKLTLHWPKRQVWYLRGTAADEQLVLAALGKKSEPEPKQSGPDADKPEKKTPPKGDEIGGQKKQPDDLAAAYRKRLADLADAIAKGQVSLIRALLDNKQLDINDRDDNGETLLMKAVAAGHDDVVRLLLEKGSDFKLTDRQGNDLYLYAASKGRAKWLQQALKDGQVRLENNNKQWSYISQGQWAFAAVLATNTLGQPAWMLAAAGGHLDDFKHLTTSGLTKEMLTLKDRNGKTAFDLASANGHAEMAEFLRAKQLGVEPKKIDPKEEVKSPPRKTPGELLLLKAVQAGDAVLLRDRLKNADLKALLQDCNEQGENALMAAAKRGDPVLVAELCAAVRRADLQALVDDKDENGKTALIYGASAGHTETVELLLLVTSDGWERDRLNWFAHIDYHDKSGKSALEHAEANKHTATVAALKGFMLKMFDRAVVRGNNRLMTILEEASYAGKAALVERMLQLGAKQPKSSRTDVPGYATHHTPLMLAAEKGDLAMVKVLLGSFGKDDEERLHHIKIKMANPANSSSRKFTALLWACEGGHYAVVRMLLEAFGDKDADRRDYILYKCTYTNSTALSLANSGNHREIAALLEKYLAAK